MRINFNYFLSLLIVLFAQLTFAQESKMSGKVTDMGGLPIPGANITAKGTTNSTQTDFDGNFSITTKKGQILTVSFIGMKSVEIAAASSMVIKLGKSVWVIMVFLLL